MAFGNGRKSIVLSDILNITTEYEILNYYFNIEQIPCVINSPLRKDEHPSFGLHSNDGIRVHYTDFSTGEKGGTFDILMQYWNLSFQEVLEKVFEDIPKFTNQARSRVNIPMKNKKVYSKETNLQVKIRDFKEHDLEFWNSFGISLSTLQFGDIYPISHIIITTGTITWTIPAEKYAYAYVEKKDGIISLKIYQPYSQNYKWSNKHDSSVWDLWSKLPEKGDKLIITSSRKDALCIWENTGIPSVSLQAESYLPKEHVINELKERFNKVYVLYDNDFQSDKKNWGRLFGALMAEKFNIIQIEIPDAYLAKDISDLCKKYNRETVKQVILNLINEEN